MCDASDEAGGIEWLGEGESRAVRRSAGVTSSASMTVTSPSALESHHPAIPALLHPSDLVFWP